ncbi:MAG: multidrug efflux MFS transporter [Novosphingobium sp.]|nr:multidrug efflux MFS transporter [Novosphingobium sp.]
MATAAPGARASAAPLPAEASAGDTALLPVANPVLLAVGIMTASLLQVLDSTIANVAIPHMRSSLGATSDEISWVLTSYIVASAVAMPITGWLADRIGSRRLFILSTAGFILSSMLCGMAQNLTQIVLFRALQGITGAFIMPLSQAAMIDTNRPSRQPQMMAIWGMGIMIGPILGPILGGWLTENWSWRAVFYVNVPLGALSLFLMITLLPSRPVARRKFDLTGFALLGTALTALQLLLDRGSRIDWFASGEAWIYAVLAASTTWMATIHFFTAREPLFNRRLFADPNYVVAMAISIQLGVVMFATIALLPPMLQQLFGYSVIDTGMVLMPRGVGTLVSMQLSGILIRKGVDARYMLAMGFSIAALSLWDMAGWSLAVDRPHIIWASLIQGLGMGLVFIPMNSMAFATLPPELRTEGSSLLNLARSIGASVGIAVVTALLASNLQVSHADLAANVTSSMINAVDVSTIDRFQMVGTTVLSTIDGIINQQAAMIAYINDFWLMMWLTIGSIPLVLLMKKADLRPPAHGATAKTEAGDLPH